MVPLSFLIAMAVTMVFLLFVMGVAVSMVFVPFTISVMPTAMSAAVTVVAVAGGMTWRPHGHCQQDDTNNKHLGDIGDKVGIHHQYNARVKGNFVLLLASIEEIAQAD